MKIEVNKVFANRQELDAYVERLGQGVSLELSQSEAESLSLDAATTVHGAQVSLVEDGARVEPGPLRGVPSVRKLGRKLGGKRTKKR